MTHLRIEQNNGVIEEVSSSVITKLYEIAHAGLDVSSNLLGRLHVSKAYGDEIDWLTANYPDLHITADSRYIKFADPLVDAKLATTWGDGIGTTIQDTQAITAIPGNFFGGTAITSFNELNNFTTITSVDWGGFIGCSNLTSVGLNNIRAVGFQSFFQCGLTGVINLPLIQTIGGTVWNLGSSFQGCTGITEVHCGSGLTRIGVSAFRDCTNLTTFSTTSTNFDICDGAFNGCAALISFTLPPNTNDIPKETFKNCTNLTTINNLANTVSLHYDAFCGCSSITNNTFDNVEFIFEDSNNNESGGYFYNCQSITEITLSPLNLVIPRYVFTYSTISTINNTLYVRRIYPRAFNNCQYLTALDLSGLDMTDQNVINAFATDSPYNHDNALFDRCYRLTTLGRTIFPNVTHIGDRCFMDCNELGGSLNFPDLSGDIGPSFTSCKKLEYLFLGHPTTLYHGNHYNWWEGLCPKCEKLKTAYLGDSVTDFAPFNFSWDTDLRAVIINNPTPPDFKILGTDDLGYSNGNYTLFTRDRMLGNNNCFLYVPDSAVNTYKATFPWSQYPEAVKSFKDYPGYFEFYNETFTNGKYQGYGFGSLKIVDSSGSGVITPSTFKNNANLEEVNLDGITTLGGGAFEGCTSLESIDLSNVTSVDSGAFMYDSALTDIGITNLRNHIGSTIGSLMFLQCSNLTGPFDFTGITRVCGSAFSLSGLSGELSLPDILRIDWQNAFSATNITKVTLGSDVTYIGGYPFAGCTSLTEVNADFSNITGNDRYISGFLYGCTSLTTVNITGLEVIGLNFFRDCTGLTQLTGLSNITDVGTNGITGCTNLVSTDIDWTKITSIGLGAFADCLKLQISSLNVPNLTNLSGYSFLNCKKLQSITNLGSTITTIEEATFNGCTELTSVTLPSSVTEIKKNGFYGCTALTTIDLSNITKISPYAFKGCSALTNIDVSNVTEIDGLCFNGIGISSLSLPSIVTIKGLSFSYNTNFTKLDFGPNLTTIGSEPFWGSTNLNTLIFRSTTVPTYTDANSRNFLFNMSGLTIYVPDASLNDYKTTGLWANMADHIKGISELPAS